MKQQELVDIRAGFETAYIDSKYASNVVYKPQFVSNNHKEGKKVIASIEDELLSCDKFVSVKSSTHLTPPCQRL